MTLTCKIFSGDYFFADKVPTVNILKKSFTEFLQNIQSKKLYQLSFQKSKQVNNDEIAIEKVVFMEFVQLRCLLTQLQYGCAAS